MFRKQQVKEVALVFTLIMFQWLRLVAYGLAIDQKPESSQSIESTPPSATKTIVTTTVTNTGTLQPQVIPGSSFDVGQDHRRPVWALAHMVNSIKELDYRLG